MATTEKLSLTLENEVLAWARKKAKANDVSLSALVSYLLRRAKQREAWDEYLSSGETGEMPLTLEELHKAEALLSGPLLPVAVDDSGASAAPPSKSRRRAAG